MARTARVVVQAERLRDQVFQLIKDDLMSGVLAPGRRLVEVELAEKYGVSRTPVREALFQLTRAGLVENSERGYVAPSFGEKDLRDRLEVKKALVPAVAAHVAATATAPQARRLVKALDKEAAAEAGGSAEAFIDANDAFRSEYYGVCDNQLLARCTLMVEGQFDAGRNRIHHLAENRRLTVEHDRRLVAAVAAHDPEAAVAEIRAFLAFLDRYYAEHEPEASRASCPPSAAR